MPTYRGIEVWIEDSEHQKLDHQDVTINLVDSDDRTVTVKTIMPRNELYTVHCRSPTSIFCDIYVFTAPRTRKSAARFYLDKSHTLSECVEGSSADHEVDRSQDHVLRTPKRRIRHAQSGDLGTVEVEIRRIDEIIKGEPNEDDETNEAGVDFVMIDEPEQPPWLVFRFDISVKESLPASPPTEKRTRGRPPRGILVKRGRPIGSSNMTSRETSRYFYGSNKRPRDGDRDRSVCLGEGPTETDSDLLREYQKEQAEERRLLQKLQEQLYTKKARNTELRRLLGEME